MRWINWTQIAATVLGFVLVTYFNTMQNALSFAIGALFTTANLIYFSWIFMVLIRKKLVALGLSLIVIKYALLAAALYYLLKTQSVDWLWVLIGFGTLIPTILLSALIQTFSNKQSEN